MYPGMVWNLNWGRNWGAQEESFHRGGTNLQSRLSKAVLQGKGRLLRRSTPYLETVFPLCNLSRLYFRRFNSYRYTRETIRFVWESQGSVPYLNHFSYQVLS